MRSVQSFLCYNEYMKKMILVYNPLASNIATVEDEVLAEARQLSGWMVGKYKIQKADFEVNLQKLMMMLGDGDLVIAAGGDGTASLAANAIMRSRKDVTLGLLGHGNFNDAARMLGMESVLEVVAKYDRDEVGKMWPLEVKVDGKAWRYALSYMSMGLMAEATEVMENPEVRERLSAKGRRSVGFSLRQAVKWYLKNRRRKFLGKGKLVSELGDEDAAVKELKTVGLDEKTTDYLAVNGPTVAGVMRGGDWWGKKNRFGSGSYRLGKFWKMTKFGLMAVKKGLPLDETRGDVIEFDEPAAVTMQIEGEGRRMEGVRKVEVKKADRVIKVVSK